MGNNFLSSSNFESVLFDGWRVQQAKDFGLVGFFSSSPMLTEINIG